VADDRPDPDRIATQQDFGRELTAIRTRAGLTVRQVARAAGLPISTAGDYFSGRHLPADGRPEQLFGILRACGEIDPELLARWMSALQRARRPPGRRPADADAPYRGLARFEREDARWFFGREDVTDLLAALADEEKQLPLVLVGPSGAGKSSLLRAGLVPRLTGPVGLVEPAGAPLAALRATLAELDASGDGTRPAIIVDQFEAVFTQCQDETERREFVTEVCDLAKAALVILALRADFYTHALRYPGLAAALQARQVVLGPMTAEQVRRAITEPARLARVDVEEGLVGLLLRDLAPPEPASAGEQAAYEPGALPLLSHALLATWEHSRGGVLTVADYLASGGIRDALAKTAEAAYNGHTPEEQQLARRLFLRLVYVADDAPPTRATVMLDELRAWGGESDHVLTRFVDERLIAVDADAAQITHDALLTAWPRLRSWIDTGLEHLLTRRRVTEAARAWQAADRESAALWRGSQLALARDWAAGEGDPSIGSLAGEFIAASIAAEQAHQHAERRRTRRLQHLVAALAVLVLAVGTLAGFAFRQRQAATSARNDANSREMAVEAGQVRGQDVPLAAQLSVAAYDTAHTPQATASLLESSGSPSAARMLDSAGVVQSVALSPDHRLLAAAAADGTLRLWDVASPGHPVPVGAPIAARSDSPLYATAFSPDGKILAAAGAGRVVQLWDVSQPGHPVRLGTLTGPANTVYSVAFSPDGRTLAAGSADDTVRLWNMSNPHSPKPLGKPLTGAAGYVQSVAFSPDGRMLAAGSADDKVRLWDVSNPLSPEPFSPEPLTGPQAMVTGVAFSPKGNLLAAASQDHKLWLWRIDNSKAIPDGTLTGAVNWLNAVAFSPDGTAVAAGTADASVLVWNLATRSLTATLPHPQPVTSVAWDGAGRLAAGDADGTVSLWTLPTPVLLTNNAPSGVAYSPSGNTLAVGGQNVQLWNAVGRTLIATRPLPAGTITNAITYSPDGDLIAIARSDGTAALLNARTLDPVGRPFRVTATGNAESVAFSPDGQLLATAADDGTVRLWSLADPAHPRQLSSVRDSGTYVYTVVFAPNGRTLAAASTDNLTRLWNVTDPHSPKPLGKPLTGPTSYVIGLAFSPDSNTLAVGSADKTVRLWNVADPAHPQQLGVPLTGPTGYVWAVAFSPDGGTLAAGVTDGTVWLWNVADLTHPTLIATLAGPQGHVFSVAYSPSGRTLAAASNDGTVHLWDASPAAAEADVCADAGQQLTRQEWATYVPGVTYRAPC